MYLVVFKDKEYTTSTDKLVVDGKEITPDDPEVKSYVKLTFYVNGKQVDDSLITVTDINQFKVPVDGKPFSLLDAEECEVTILPIKGDGREQRHELDPAALFTLLVLSTWAISDIEGI